MITKVASRLKGGRMENVVAESEPEIQLFTTMPKRKNPEWVRAMWHVLSIGGCGLIAYLLDPVLAGWVLCFFLVFMSSYDLYMSYEGYTFWLGKLYHRAISLCFGWLAELGKHYLLRDNEKKTRVSSTDFMVGISLSYLIFSFGLVSNHQFVTMFFILAICDPVARIVGITLGSHQWHGKKKTIEGSIACCISAAIVHYLCLGSVLQSLVLGVGVAWVELGEQRIWELPESMHQTWGKTIISPADNGMIAVTITVIMTICNLCGVLLPTPSS